MGRLVGATGDQQLGDLFRGASALHMNFYENWMPAELVSGGLDQVENLVSKLEH
jgi:hypothetical protein